MSPKIKYSDITYNMNKKYLTIGTFMLAGTILLSGCTATEKPEPKPTATASQVLPTVTVEAATVNKLSTLVATANFDNGIKVNAYQEAYGYPSEEQLAYFKDIALPQEKRKPSKAQPEVITQSKKDKIENKTFGNSPLVASQRIVVIRYEVVNTSSSPVNVKIFTNNLGYFAEDTTENPLAFADASADSLHGKMGISSYPTNFNPESPEWLLAPGETATWGLDWLVPKELLSKQDITLVQNFSIGDTWVSGVKLPLKVDGVTKQK